MVIAREIVQSQSDSMPPLTTVCGQTPLALEAPKGAVKRACPATHSAAIQVATAVCGQRSVRPRTGAPHQHLWHCLENSRQGVRSTLQTSIRIFRLRSLNCCEVCNNLAKYISMNTHPDYHYYVDKWIQRSSDMFLLADADRDVTIFVD